MEVDVKSRKEIVFIYDAKLVNPNGDPLDENKPRFLSDGETEIVTDVRLKRSIRDFIERNKEKDEFLNKRGAKVWLIEEKNKDGNRKSKEEQLKEKNDYQNYNDIKLFGATILPNAEEGKKKENITITGPVQFRFGISKNKVNPLFIKGTTVSPSGKDKLQGTFTERWVVDYSLISFYGIFNENVARVNASSESPRKIEVKGEDLEVLYYSIWHGIQDLTSQSKVGQNPRLLLIVNYKNSNFQIGDLDTKLKLKNREANDIDKCELDMHELIDALVENKGRIDHILYHKDDALRTYDTDKEIDFKETMKQNDIDVLDFGREYNF